MSNKFNYAVVGAGRMGRAAASCLVRNGKARVVSLHDVDESVHDSAETLRAQCADEGLEVEVNSFVVADDDFGLTNDVDVVVATCGYQRYVKLGKACAKFGAGMVDLGGNRDVVEAQKKELNGIAAEANVTFVPDQGIAPGTINILGMGAFKELEALGAEDITVVMRVGGIPKDPGDPNENPARYTLTWSADGLINEYVIPSDAIEDGKRVVVPALTQREQLVFHNKHTLHEFEAFVTGGGTSNLTDLLDGKVKNCNYKTIRYLGHLHSWKLLEKLGFHHNPERRKVLTEALEENLIMDPPEDIILARAGAMGTVNGETVAVGTDVVCVRDPVTGHSAMGQTTGYAAAVIASMIADGSIANKGVVNGEEAVNHAEFVKRYKEAGIEIGPMNSLADDPAEDET
jgi:saccharopine dehydrogenase-like NADP-dependent oxidoreductase